MSNSLFYFLESLEKKELQALATYHNIKARAQDKLIGFLWGFYEENGEAFVRDLGRLDVALLRDILASLNALDAAWEIRGQDDFEYNSEALSNFLAACSKEQLVGFTRSLFLDAKIPKELSAFEQEYIEEKIPVLEIILEELNQAALSCLAELRGVKGARSMEARRKILLDAYQGDVSTLLQDLAAVNDSLLPSFLCSALMLGVARQIRGDKSFSYRAADLQAFLGSCPPEKVLAMAQTLFVEGVIPEEFGRFEIEVDEQGRNEELEREERAAQIAEMEKVPHDDNLTPERALSIRQPWAELILQGIKTIEVRSIPTHIRERVYIYAGNSSPGEEGSQKAKKHGIDADQLPRGVIVGTVQIVGCLPLEKEDGNKAGFDVEAPEGLYGWHLARPTRIKKLLKPTNHPQPVFFKPF